MNFVVNQISMLRIRRVAMKGRNYNNAELGLLAGILLGALIGVYLFTLNGHILYISLSGLGAVIGLGIGTGLDISRDSQD
jgi:Mg/Co/Ni transporter MgtE